MTTPTSACPPRTLIPSDFQKQHGLSLIIVMLILIVVSVLGIGGIQIAAHACLKKDKITIFFFKI